MLPGANPTKCVLSQDLYLATNTLIYILYNMYLSVGLSNLAYVSSDMPKNECAGKIPPLHLPPRFERGIFCSCGNCADHFAQFVRNWNTCRAFQVSHRRHPVSSKFDEFPPTEKRFYRIGFLVTSSTENVFIESIFVTRSKK
jgi:hypothetical protein